MNHRSGAWCATRWRILAIICLWSLACARQPAPAIDAALPLDCSGILGPEASAASLAERFGAANVAEDSVALGDTEGDMLPASRLFPRDSSRRAAIVWWDAQGRRRPRYVYIDGPATAWRTPEGIRVGTPLAELERLNGRPFQLAGFAFDEAGAVTSWEGGRLEPYKTGQCRIHLWLDSLTFEARSTPFYKEVIGDRFFSSQHPAMRALQPRVSRMILYHDSR